jgi:phosphate transport system protein
MSKHLQHQIEALKQKILLVGTLVEDAIAKAISALVNRNGDLARSIIERDDEIDRMEVDVEEECLKVLALYQPVAADLRFVVAVLKINNDLERMGDHAVNIAECARNLAQEPPLPFNRDLFQMAEFSTRMMKESLDAFVSRDVGKAKGVCDQDDRVGGYKNRILNELLGAMTQDSKVISRALSLILIARNLERIADLSTNIAEETIFISEARVIKHHAEEGEIT